MGMLLLMIVGGSIGAVVVLIGLLMAMGALRDRLAGVPALKQLLVRRRLDSRLIALMELELQMASGGAGLLFAFIFIVAGIPAVALGASELQRPSNVSPENIALYLGPGLALLALAVVLMVRGRARLDQSPTYVALVARGPRAIELVPTSQQLWIYRANLALNVVGVREKVLTNIPHVAIRYDDGASFTLRAFTDETSTPTLECLAALLPQCAVASYQGDAVETHAVPAARRA